MILGSVNDELGGVTAVNVYQRQLKIDVRRWHESSEGKKFFIVNMLHDGIEEASFK
jgi:hypothetical protein